MNDELGRRVAERTEQLRELNEELHARNRQQAALAALGQTAIGSPDLATLLSEATTVTAETLGSELALVGEWLRDGEGFRIRAAGGEWREGLAGGTLTGEDAGMVGDILRSSGRGVVAEVRAGSRFAVCRREQGAFSASGVVVRGPSGGWGGLAVFARRSRSFSPDELGFLQSVANLLSLAVERDELAVAQRREKETLEAIFDNIPVMISITDTAERLQRVNREWERTLGWTLEEARRVDLLTECYPDPERQGEVIEFYRQVQSRWADFPMLTRDHRAIETSWACFDISDGSRISLGLDITERKQAEEERARLLESESRARREAEAALERLRAIQSITDLALASLALDDLLRELLARLRRAIGGDYASIQLLDETHDSLFIRAADGVAFDLVKAVRVPIGHGVGGRIAADGRPRVVHDLSTVDTSKVEGLIPELRALLRGSMLGTPLQVEGRVIGVLSAASVQPHRFTAEDLQLLQVVADRVAPAIERCRLAEAARRAEALFRAVVEDQGEMIVRWTPDGTRTFVNKAYGRMLGKSADELVGTSLWPLAAEPYREQELQRIRKLTPDAPYSTGVHESLLPDGTTKWTEWTDRALFDEQGRLVELQSVGRDITERKQAEEEIRRYAARLASLSRRLLSAQEEERHRLAVELHDELGQVLTAVKINLASLERQADGSRAPAPLKEAIASVDQAMERVRDLALDLRPSVLDDLGLAAALRWYADRFARTTHIRMHLAIDVVPHLPPDLQTACFRVAQEALTNVARHAQARNVWIDLHVSGAEIDLRVRDDGIGFDAGVAREYAIGGGSMGLLGMQERVSLAGGEYQLCTRPGGGTEVKARLPLGARAPALP